MSLIETLAKHMIILKDSTYTEILQFLDSAEEFGKNIQIVIKTLLVKFIKTFHRPWDLYKAKKKETACHMKPDN